MKETKGRNRTNRWCLLLAPLVCLLFAACEKVTLDENGHSTDGKKGNLTITAQAFSVTPFESAGNAPMHASTRSSVDIKQVCSRLSISVFRNDEKVAGVTQSSTDKDFGKASFTLSEGVYEIVVIGHNGNGAATISYPYRLAFANNLVSDTFYAYQELTVTGEKQDVAITTSRSVSMFRFLLTDTIPSVVKKMKFYYTGGSSTFDATSGFGCVNSRQTVPFDVKSDDRQFDLYTFPHATEDELKMTVTALDNAGNTIQQKVFDAVPLIINCIPTCEGAFFGDLGGDIITDGNQMTIWADSPEWNDTIKISF